MNQKQQIKQDKFIKRMKDTFEDEYTVLGEFKTTNTKCLIKHKCGYEWTPYPSNLFSGQSKCPKCSGKVRWNIETFKEKVAEIDNTYSVIGEYKNNYTRIILHHNTCGYDWKVKATDFIYGNVRCPRCQNRERYNSSDFGDLVTNMTNAEYELKGEYVNNREDVEFLHIECGTVFMESPTSFLYSEQRCPLCNDSSMSKGEKKISDLLSSLKVNFVPQHTFADCKFINRLRFDFAIMNKEKVLGIIEFDGGQHFKPVELFGGEEGFESCKKRDQIKDSYCLRNSIPLLRIPFWDYNKIEKLTKEFLKEVNK